jgi:hypothetical protein
MENMKITQLKIRKDAYLNAANLVRFMEDYGMEKEEEARKLLDLFASISDGLPLPSGRWGNAIALALEINNYVAAEYLINNAEELGLETNTVVSELGFKNPWGLREEYLFSQLTYVKPGPVIYAGDERFTKYLVRNHEANVRLSEQLNNQRNL